MICIAQSMEPLYLAPPPEVIIILLFLTLTAAALVGNGWIVGVRVLLLFHPLLVRHHVDPPALRLQVCLGRILLLPLLLFDVSTKILVLLPHLSHGKQLEVGLGSLVLWEDVVE